MGVVVNPSSVAVVTIAAGRHDHLRGQLRSLRRQHFSSPFRHIVVSMGDPQVKAVVAEETDRGRSADRRTGAQEVEVLEIAVGADGELPLAAARNIGAAAALDGGADLLVFLDVDCLAGPGLLEDYRRAVADDTSTGPVLWCGEVAYLPPLPDHLTAYPLDELDALAAPHPARPTVSAGDVVHSDDLRLFWSLNFAVTADDWRRLGGFHLGYHGYGGEDTDFAATADSLGGTIGWIGGARCHHQYHPTSSPPWQHLSAIVRNATLFHHRWGRFPMEGWLTAFAAAGAVDYRPDDGVLQLKEPDDRT